MEIFDLLIGALLLRPYVFFFLAVALSVSIMLMGRSRTAAFFCTTGKRQDKARTTVACEEEKRKGNRVHEGDIHDPEFLIPRGIDVVVISEWKPDAC